MATNNAVNVTLSGQTGTGAFVGNTSPTFVTPNIGVATATSIEFSPSTNNIIGTTAGDNAGSGIIGEFISASRLFASALSLTSGVALDILSIALPTGDWTIEGNLFLNCSGSLTTSYMYVNVNSASRPDNSFLAGYVNTSLFQVIGQAVVPRRVTFASPMTIFLIADAVFTGTCTASGHVQARRMR